MARKQTPETGSEALPSFPLFPDPVGVGVIEKSKKKCDCCGRARGWIYTGPVYCADDEPSLCPWCIADGSAAEKFDATFNDTGTLYAHPSTPSDPPADELETVEQRTPGYNNWQGNCWYACCGHAAVYLGDASGEDLSGRWADAVDVVFADSESIFEELGGAMQDLERGESPGVYVFRCSHCGKLGGYFDMD
jgi:uncharacterized protein CbrC (UPF0167 family)